MKMYATHNADESGRLMMTRAAFLRMLGFGAAGVAGALAGLGRVAQANAQPVATSLEVDVYPTGVFPRDFEEVSAAVNGGVGPSGHVYAGGGTVRLKATNASGDPAYFNFGDGVTGRKTVEIVKDVVILGELTGPTSFTFPNHPAPIDDYKPDRTVIYGGKRPFACRPESPAPTRLTLRDIYFAYPSLAAVQVAKSAGLEVTDCVVYEVEWDSTGLPTPPRAAVGIEASGGAQPNPELFGDFRVIGNKIRRAEPTTSPTNFSGADMGIVLQRARMKAQISANEVSRFAFGGIGIDRNEGPATVAGNVVSHCGYGSASASAGIGVRGTSLPVAFERNDITCGPCGPSLWSRNGIFVASANFLLRSNAIRGSVLRDGIQLGTFTPMGSPVTYRATDGRIFSNRLTDLVAGHAQLCLLAGCDTNQLTNNEYGGVDLSGSDVAGIVVSSNDNQLINEYFWGTYPGISGTPAVPCVWLTAGSYGNRVTALKYRDEPPGVVLCEQIRDGGSNLIPGYQQCKRR